MAVNIYWGSETGTGEFFGGELAKELTAAGLKVEGKRRGARDLAVHNIHSKYYDTDAPFISWCFSY